MSARQQREGLPRLQDGFSRSLERALCILQALAAREQALGVTEIAEDLRMARTTTHRQLRALASLGYVRQDAQRRYALSLRVTELGMGAWSATPLAVHGQPAMAQLARESGLVVELSVLDGPEVLLIGRSQVGRRAQREAQPPLRRRRPAHCTAAGKILLAHLPARAQQALLRQEALTPHTAGTITDRRALRAQLQRARTEGIAVAEDELAAGTSSIAVPIHERDLPCSAALALIAERYASDSDGLREQHGAQLAAAARAISARLGWRIPSQAADTRGGRSA